MNAKSPILLKAGVTRCEAMIDGVWRPGVYAGFAIGSSRNDKTAPLLPAVRLDDDPRGMPARAVRDGYRGLRFAADA